MGKAGILQGGTGRRRSRGRCSHGHSDVYGNERRVSRRGEYTCAPVHFADRGAVRSRWVDRQPAKR